jgi:pimeloyl-ACP methyl ester carboxylesterase
MSKFNVRKIVVIAIILVLVTNSLHSQALSNTGIHYGSNNEAGKYCTVNGTKIYYEIYGEGHPLLLLHGNGGSIESNEALLPMLSKKYKVIAVDSRCHGKSGCPVGPLLYEQMASDMNKLLDILKIDPVFIYGHSDGAIVGLLMAINYPSKVKKLLAVGSNLRPDSTAIVPEVFPLLPMLKSQLTDSVELKRLNLMIEQPHIADASLHSIKCDVLIMAGDRDFIRNEHTLEIFNNIPGALLCILPGTTHFVADQRQKWFTEIMLDFFDNPPSRTTSVEIYLQQKN